MTSACSTLLLVLAFSTEIPDPAVASYAAITVYTIYTVSTTWNKAREVCVQNGGHLLTIHNETDWKLWEFLMNHDLDSHPRPSSTYWIGLHAPDPDNPDSFYWDTCDLAQFTKPLVEDIPSTFYPCVYVWFHREVFNGIFMNLWLKDKPCNQMHPFICVTQKQESACASACDEVLVIHVTSQTTCIDACNDLACTSSFQKTLGVCHLKMNREQNQKYLNLCWSSSLDLSVACTAITDFVISTATDVEDDNTNVTNQTCMEKNRVTIVENNVTTTAISNYHVTTEEPICMCSCDALQTFLAEPKAATANLTVEEKVDIIVKELTIDKKNTTSSQRRLVSVMDSRPSSVGIGAVGVGIIVGIFGIIVVMDLTRLWHQIVKMLHKVLVTLSNNKVHVSN